MRLPQRIGDYTLLEQLGAGSFGTVYRARIEGDLGFSQQVAVKLVDSGRARARPNVITSLADEAQFLARLNHPNIVAVRRFVRVDHEFLGEAHLMEMELVRGAPLSCLLRKVDEVGTRLPVDAALSLLLEGVDALVYAHDLKDADGKGIGLVHRDLKPDNLLVSHDGRLKVLDFGIAWAEDRIATTTATGLAKGTPQYMSPEQARGEPADPRSDLYALGAIAFECITGHRYVSPPQGGRVELPVIIMAVATTTFEGRVDVLEKALVAPEPVGRAIDPNRARGIIELLGRMLAPNIEERPASAALLAHDLEELCSAWKPHLGRRYLRTAIDGIIEPVTDPHADTMDRELNLTLSERADFDSFREAFNVGAVGPTRMAPPGLREGEGQGPGGPKVLAIVLVGAALLALGILAIIGPQDRGTDSPEPAADAVVDAAEVEDEPRAEIMPEPVTEEAEPEPTRAPEPEPTPERRTPAPRVEPSTPASRIEPAPTPAPQPTIPSPVWPKLSHTPPAPYMLPATLTISVRLEGGSVDCEPEVLIRPVMPSPIQFTRTAMASAGTSAWSATMALPYGEGWNVGAEYYFRCCQDGSCGAGLRNQANPFRVDKNPF